MIIGIDANWAIYENAGIGQYSRNLIKNLLQTDTKNQYILYFNFIRHFSDRKKQIDEMTRGAKIPVKVKISYFPAAWKEFLTQTNIPFSFFYKDKLDVFFTPFFSGVPVKTHPKTVVTIHDLVFLHFPEHRGTKLSNYYLKRTRNACLKSAKIIAVSENTKNDLERLLRIPSGKMTVVYEASEDIFTPQPQITTRTKLAHYNLTAKNYILSVCTLEPRKNLLRLIKAYSDLPHTIKQKYQLVLVGKSGWNNAKLDEIIQELNIADRVVKTGYVPQEDLPYLYAGAAVFAYPALYEGFGLPPLEAMRTGVPVITSETSSLPEVVGKAAILVDPQNEDEITSALKEVLTRPKLAEKMRTLGKAQAKNFSWQKAAVETIKVFEELA